uniref:Dynein regulatory complex protein 1 n=1 Tax=Hippocampus comes TaxID=109280 RepID=A0A3Q2YZ32_HIPCM
MHSKFKQDRILNYRLLDFHELEVQNGIYSLERDLLALVIDIQAAADAKESLRREELEVARNLERLEKEVNSSQEKFEEITARWSLAEQTVIPYELQETLKWQQLLCAELIEDKRKVIKDLQQELKSGDDRFVKDLRRQANEIDQMMQRSEELVSLLTQAYREELDQIEVRSRHQEYDVLLTKDQTEWEQCVQELWDQQVRRQSPTPSQFPFVMRQPHVYVTDRCACSKSGYLQTELKNLRRTYLSGKKQSEEQSSRLSGDYKRGIEQYQCMQQRIKHFAVSDAKQFEETWRMLDKEVRQQAEKALLIDRMIYKQHLNLPWARPRAASSLGLSDPDHLWKQASAEQSASLPESSAGMDGAAAAPAEEKLPLDTIKELMELLCDELGFLTEDRLQLLATLDKKEQNVIKLETLLQVYFASLERRSHATGQPCYWSADMWDSSADEAYWESLANVIPEDQLKVWESAELVLKKHMAVLTKISDRIPEIERLEQQNAELRRLLQRSVDS